MASIQFDRVTKHFPGVTALGDVSFDVRSGSCHAICGENGAGKSTLGRILAGLDTADSGEIRLDGVPARFGSPRAALAVGVAMVHQELAFCENLTVADNLSLGRLPARWYWIDHVALVERATALLAAVGSAIDPTRSMHTLGVADQQVVQIAAAVGAGARVIVFDEPTSSLGERETERLVALIRELTVQGVTILYVTHRMPEIFALCDRVTVLRDGEVVSTDATNALDESALVERMIGRGLARRAPGATAAVRGEEQLRVDRLAQGMQMDPLRPKVRSAVGRSNQGSRFRDISFVVHSGEIVGLAGLVGAGRSEIVQALFGLEHDVSGGIFVRGRPARIESPRDAMALGIGLVPEDRKHQGLVLSMTAEENVTLPALRRFARWIWIDRRAERRAVVELFDRLRVRASSTLPVAALSGGTQQKTVLAKWLAAASDILLLDEPTRGVDVGAKAEIHEWIERLAADGAAIVLVSSELPELLQLSTRILVIRDGTIVGEVSRGQATQEGVLRMMAGLSISSPGP